MALFDQLQQQFPWMEQLGITPAWLQQVAATSSGPEEIMAKIRQSNGYKRRFVGLLREDGSMRMTEAQYIQTENAYRDLLRQYGFDVDRDYSTPTSLIGWFNSEVSPDQLQSRLQVWDHLRHAGRNVIDAFYVYTGKEITTDNLYEAVVDPAAAMRMSREYNLGVAEQRRNYSGWIERAANVGLKRVVESLEASQAQGTLTAEAIQRIQNIDPDFATQMMDAIFTNGDPLNQGTGTLSLNELLSSFEYAIIGGAAENAGLGLPTRERLAEIRSAGVSTEEAVKAYSEYGRDKNVFDAAVRRARGRGFTTSDFEASQFLSDADEARALEAGMNYMEQSGRATGGFQFSQDEQGRFQQRGFSSYAA